MELTRKGKAAHLLMMLSLALLTGCSEDDASMPTSWFTTKNIYAYMKAVQHESGNITTSVELRSGNGPDAAYLYLGEDERLYGTLNIPPKDYFIMDGDLFSNSQGLSQDLKVMTSRFRYTNFMVFDHTLPGAIEYFTINTTDALATPVRAYVDYDRGGILVGESSVELPPAFKIQNPIAESTLSRATPIDLVWSNTDPTTTMSLDVAGDCTDGSRYILHPDLVITSDPDTGTSSVTLNGADYFSFALVDPSQTCRVAFILNRTRLGSVSSKFAFGTFRGIQQRTVQFISIP